MPLNLSHRTPPTGALPFSRRAWGWDHGQPLAAPLAHSCRGGLSGGGLGAAQPFPAPDGPGCKDGQAGPPCWGPGGGRRGQGRPTPPAPEAPPQAHPACPGGSAPGPPGPLAPHCLTLTTDQRRKPQSSRPRARAAAGQPQGVDRERSGGQAGEQRPGCCGGSWGHVGALGQAPRGRIN